MALYELYGAHYQSLVHVAEMVVRDVATAEEVVQDAFVALYGAWSRLRDTGKARAYLQQSVINRSRSVLRHRAVEDKHAPAPATDSGTEEPVTILLDRYAVVAALRGLPDRQREAVVLRFYADLSEADIAKAMGISRGTVKSHTARGVSALREVLDDTGSPDHGDHQDGTSASCRRATAQPQTFRPHVPMPRIAANSGTRRQVLSRSGVRSRSPWPRQHGTGLS
jgi:RNA polymerase sigma-70 factor (sigma-E family)